MGILQRCESRRGARVIWLAVHSSEGNDRPRVNDAVSLRDAGWWTGSSHAICDNEALLTPAEGCVPYDLAAWTLRSGNRFSDNIEQIGWARWSRREWLDHEGTLDHTARWLADRHKARPWIPLTKLSPAEVNFVKPGVIGHADYTYGTGDGSHWDPGPDYPWDVVIDKARAYADPKPTPPKLEEVPDMLVVWIQHPTNKAVKIPHLITGDRYFSLASIAVARSMEKAGVPSIDGDQNDHRVFVAALASERASLQLPPDAAA